MYKHHFIKKIKLVLIIVAILLTAYILSYFFDMYNTKKQSKLLNEIVTNLVLDDNMVYEDNNGGQDNTSVEKNDTSLHEEINQPDTKIIEKNERMLKLQSLQLENPDIVGWLEIPGTVINYPVLQGSDNEFYVNHNYQKQKTQSGSIFIDADYNWNPKSTNLLIYGHNMKNGTMFTSLVNYKSKQYYYAHPNIRFTTNNNDATYEIIASFESKIYDKSDTSSFKYYNFINASNQNEFDYFVSNVKSISLYDTGKTAQYGDDLMTLSTCAYHTKNGRFAVVARKSSN